MKEEKKRDWQKSFLILLCVVLVGLSSYFFILSRKNHDQAAKQKQIIARISEVIELPQEDPVIVTVTDKTRLSNKSLAARVNDSDALFIYNKAKRLVIYRPSNQKVIDILSFSDQDQVPATNQQKATTR